MFIINSVRLQEWPARRFKLRRGENRFKDRSEVPESLWEQLKRFRAAGFLSFEDEGAAPAEPPPAHAEGEPLPPGAYAPLGRELEGLKFEALKGVAQVAGVDTAGMTSKRQIIDAVHTAQAAAELEVPDDFPHGGPAVPDKRDAP